MRPILAVHVVPAGTAPDFFSGAENRWVKSYKVPDCTIDFDPVLGCYLISQAGKTYAVPQQWCFAELGPPITPQPLHVPQAAPAVANPALTTHTSEPNSSKVQHGKRKDR